MPPTDDVDPTQPDPTQDEPIIADMYERWTLDCVIEVTQAIARDFVNRPRQYKEIDQVTLPSPGNELIGRILGDFWYQTGTDPNFPDLAKRQMIFTPLLGPSDGKPGEKASQFHSDTAALRERARAFTERQVETGEDNLRQAFIDEVVTLQSYLETLLSNAVVINGDRQTRNIFNRASQVLLDGVVTGVFGRPPSTAANWPLAGSFDQNGARVIEEAAKALALEISPTQSQFIIMQRIGHFGAETLRGVVAANLPPSPIKEIDELIKTTYSWKTALDALMM